MQVHEKEPRLFVVRQRKTKKSVKQIFVFIIFYKFREQILPPELLPILAGCRHNDGLPPEDLEDGELKLDDIFVDELLIKMQK